MSIKNYALDDKEVLAMSQETQFDLQVVLNLLKSFDAHAALKKLLNLAIEKVGVEGGTFYSYYNHYLYPIYVINKPLELSWEPDESGDQLSTEYAIHLPTQPNHFCVKALQIQDVVIENNIQTLPIADLYKTLFFQPSTPYLTESLLTIPIFHKSSPIGVFQLVNAIDSKTRKKRDFIDEDTTFSYLINEIASSHLNVLDKKKGKSLFLLKRFETILFILTLVFLLSVGFYIFFYL